MAGEWDVLAEAREALGDAIRDSWHSTEMVDECWIDYEATIQALAARGWRLAVAPSPEPLPLDVERLARALVATVRIDAYRAEPRRAAAPDPGYWHVAEVVGREYSALAALSGPREPAP